MWSQVRSLLLELPGQVAALALSSVAAGLAEAGILAVLAQAALLLANHRTAAHLAAGPLRLHIAISALLALGIGLAVARLILGLVISFVPARIADVRQFRLRSELFAAFSEATWDVQSRDREGQFQELITGHVAQATQACAFASLFVTSLLTFLVLVVSAIALSPVAALGIILVVGMLALVLRPLGTLGHRQSRTLSQGWLAYATGVNEAVRLAEEAHVFGIHGQQREQLDELLSGFRRANLHSRWLSNLVTSVYQGFIYLLLLLALALLDALHAGQISSLGVVVLLLVRSGSYGQQLQAAVQSLSQAQPYDERLRTIERRYRESIPTDGHESLTTVTSLGFEAVSFAYDPGQLVLDGITFTVTGGETIGIVGPSGAGKSTLVQILLGLRRPTSGKYLVNGISAAEIARSDWQRAVSYVPQEPRLLHASVWDNIRFFRDISDEAIRRAARYAGINDEIATWPDGYDTIIGPRADGISGGQQQRICLARAVAGSPRVLILDEPTSALDPLTELVIQRSLMKLRTNLTLFIVAHRMSTVEVCDRIMVISDGRLQAFGAVDELQSDNSYYRAAAAANSTRHEASQLADVPADGDC